MQRNYSQLYVTFLKKFLRVKRPLKIVCDASNGTAGLILKQLFKDYPTLQVEILNSVPDGHFPAHSPNPLDLEATTQLQQRVRKIGADLGIIFDADGDRVFFVDNQGERIDSNEIGFILMRMFRPPYVIGAVSSWRLTERKTPDRTGKNEKQKMYVSRVGHYFFKTLMRKQRANLGIEHSGHYYFKKFFYCDSGIFAAIQVINFVSGLDTNVGGWLNQLPRYYRSGEMNFTVSDTKTLVQKVEQRYQAEAKKILHIDGVTLEFADWWCNLRPSNTENLLRLNIEARSESLLQTRLQELKKLLT